jgi:hypothetical protein
MMECDICHHRFRDKRQPLCASCVQATLYGPRLEQATALLSHEKAHIQAEAVIRPGNHGVIAALPEDADYDAIENGVKSHGLERMKAEHLAAEARIKDITARSEELKLQIEQYKASASKQKEDSARKRKDVTTKRAEVQKQHGQAIEPVQLAGKKAKHRLNKTHSRTVEAREYICNVAASLSGLKRIKSRDNRSIFWLSGLPIPDLRDLNGTNTRIRLDVAPTSPEGKPLTEPHELISASLDNVCRFLGLCCHYLSIRLPAEVILPHGDFPHAAIMPVDSSYKSSKPRYPGSSSSRSTSPEASRLLLKTELSRPRLLQLDRPFPQLEKEDPKAAAFFREGVMLLAYDIAWLCRSQGHGTGTTFEDICEIGRNLYELMPRQDDKQKPALNHNSTAATNAADRTAIEAPSPPRLGSHSHGSNVHSLAGYEGAMLFGQGSKWAVSIPRLTDQLKSYLRRESQRAEWDIIETTEWDEETEDDRPVFVGGARRSLEGKHPAMSVMTVKPSDDVDVDQDRAATGKGNNGWMKVRGRVGDT